MKDSKGNKFDVGTMLHSSQSQSNAGTIKCIAINIDVATFERPGSKETFKLNQNNMNSSYWITN